MSEQGSTVPMDDPNFWAKMFPEDQLAASADIKATSTATLAGADRIKPLKPSNFDPGLSLGRGKNEVSSACFESGDAGASRGRQQRDGRSLWPSEEIEAVRDRLLAVGHADAPSLKIVRHAARGGDAGGGGGGGGGRGAGVGGVDGCVVGAESFPEVEDDLDDVEDESEGEDLFGDGGALQLLGNRREAELGRACDWLLVKWLLAAQPEVRAQWAPLRLHSLSDEQVEQLRAGTFKGRREAAFTVNRRQLVLAAGGTPRPVGRAPYNDQGVPSTWSFVRGAYFDCMEGGQGTFKGRPQVAGEREAVLAENTAFEKKLGDLEEQMRTEWAVNKGSRRPMAAAGRGSEKAGAEGSEGEPMDQVSLLGALENKLRLRTDAAEFMAAELKSKVASARVACLLEHRQRAALAHGPAQPSRKRQRDETECAPNKRVQSAVE
eukprot:2528754-Pleurochrysis_carterae.AAC.3